MHRKKRALAAVLAAVAAGVLLSAGNAYAEADGRPRASVGDFLMPGAQQPMPVVATADLRVGLRRSIVNQSVRPSVRVCR